MERKDVTLKDSKWNYTLPKIEWPFLGESLFGYMLRLDYINDFAPGTIIKSILTSEQFSNLTKSYDMEIFEEDVNTTELSNYTGLPISEIERLKLSHIRKKIFGSNDKYAKESLKYGWLKICPICLQSWRIPQLFLLPEVNMCIIHGLKLLDRCECSKRIDILAKANPFQCKRKNCNRNYTDICEVPKSDMQRQSYVQSLINSYFYQDASLSINKDNIKNELNQKISLLIEIREKATEYIISIISIPFSDVKLIPHEENKHLFYRYYFSPYIVALSPYDRCYYDNKFDIFAFINILINYGLTPYQFLNINGVKDKIKEIYLLEIGITPNIMAQPSILKEFGKSSDSLLDLLNKSIQNFSNKFSNKNIIKNENDKYWLKLLIRNLLFENIPFTINGKVNVETFNFTVSLKFSLSKFHNTDYIVLHI